MKILIISAHPDDETIGAGGTIARHVANGDEVFWCVVTQAYSPPWPEETLKAAKRQIEDVRKIYGIQKVYRLGFPTVKLNTIPYIDLSSALQKVVDDVKPEVIYTTPRDDINQDHRIVHDCTLVAARPLPDSPVKRIASYEIGPTSRYGIPSGAGLFTPNLFVDITPFLEKKLEAMACYEMELHKMPHPRSLEGLRLLAHERGLSVGLKAAECFNLIREII